MKKNLFLRLFLMMAVLLSTYSCRQDLLPEKETYHNTSEFQLKSSKISLKESKHKAKLLPELKKAEVEIKASAKNNIFGKTVNYGNGVSIDTESVIYIENGPNFHTYTFSIKRENAQENAPLENLLLVPLPDGKYKEFLITYNLTALEKEKLQAGLFIDTKGKTQVTELASGTFNGGSQLARLVCVTSSYSYWSSCSGSQHHDGSNYASCPIYQGVESGTPPINYTVVTTTCIEPGPAVITPIPTPGEGSGGGPGECPDCPDNTTPQPCIQIPTDPTQPSSGIVDENGCAIGLPSLPNLPSTHDPCWSIKTNFANARFMQKVTAIDKPEVFAYDHEMGYAAGYPPANTGVTGTQYPPMENALGTHNVTLPTGNQYFGFMHSHNNESNGGYPVKIFSPADLATFLTSCVDNANTNGNIGDAYTMVITSQGNYILKYTGFSSTFGIGPNTIKFWKTWYERAVLDIQNQDGSIDQDKTEKMFLRFLKEKVKIDGIQLYQVEKITGKAKELTLDVNNNVIPIPCD